MVRDKRLFMTFPIDFPEHPKVKPLSVHAKWAFVEMNGYSRRYNLDGRIPKKTALANWSAKILAELVASHPDRPLVLLDGDTYVLRDYAEHQETTETIEARRVTGYLNGVKGGRPRKQNPKETQRVSRSSTAGDPEQNQSQSPESELEDKTDQTHDSEVHHVIPARADLTDSEFLAESASRLGIKRLSRVLLAFESVVGRIDGPQAVAVAVDVAGAVLGLATDHVRWPEAYLERTAKDSPETVRTEWVRVAAMAPKAVSA